MKNKETDAEREYQRIKQSYESVDANEVYAKKIALREDEEEGTSRLPDGFVELEYIESTGTQYIDTNYSPTINTGIEIKFNVTSGNGSPFGCYGENNDNRYWIRTLNRIHYMSKYGGEISYNFSTNTDYIFFMNYMNNRQYKINNDSNIQLNSPVAGRMKTLFLFAFHSASGIGDFMNGKIYYTKLTENNVLVHDYIPGYRESDHKVGLFDLVEGEFYTNKATTGNDFRGPEVK